MPLFCFLPSPLFFFPFFLGSTELLFLFIPGRQADSKTRLNWECYAALKGRAKPKQTLPPALSQGSRWGGPAPVLLSRLHRGIYRMISGSPRSKGVDALW